MRSGTELLAYATWRSAVCRVLRLRQGTAAQRTKWCTRSSQPWDPMDPPEVGPIWYPGLCHPVRSGTRSSEIQYNAPYHTGISLCTAGTAEQEVIPSRGTRQPWDPMDPPEVGPRRYPGLSGRVRANSTPPNTTLHVA